MTNPSINKTNGTIIYYVRSSEILSSTHQNCSHGGLEDVIK